MMGEVMIKEQPLLNIGEIVEILTGREKGKYGVIIGKENDRYIFIADGDKRKFDQPKRKNIRHIRATGYISKEIVDSLDKNGKVTNAKLRYVLQDYLSNRLPLDEEKGE